MKKAAKYTIHPKIQNQHALLCREIASGLGVPLFLAELLYQRGIVTADTAKKFLEPKLVDLPSPLGLKGMQGAVEMILDAVASKSQVVIHGDYDVDGITSTVLLADFMAMLDLEVACHLPNRMSEGYGLSVDSLARLAKKVRMPALLITVDCGITSVEEVRYAKELGFKVIVTDHHEPSGEIPPAGAIVNPKQQGCEFECKTLSGVGVVFFLVMAVRAKMVEKGFWNRQIAPNLKKYLDLVALGTVADVVELVGVNRILVKAGLEVITARNRPGVWALCESAGITDDLVTAEDISFRLAPRINAAGRLGEPQLAADLLLSCEIKEALNLAAALEKVNTERREIEKKALVDAKIQAQKQVDRGRNSLVLFDSKWHPGVVGIIAARVVDQYQLPVLVFTVDIASGKEILKASGRSVPGLNLFKVLQLCDTYIDQFGGHAMAVGLTLPAGRLDHFSEEFDSCVSSIGCEVAHKGLVIDKMMSVDDNCEEVTNCLKLMEPFGHGNPEPVFLLKNIRMARVSTLRDHLKFTLHVNGCQVHGIGFFMAPQIEVALGPIDFAFKLKKSIYRGRKRIEAHAVSIAQAADI